MISEVSTIIKLFPSAHLSLLFQISLTLFFQLCAHLNMTMYLSYFQGGYSILFVTFHNESQFIAMQQL